MTTVINASVIGLAAIVIWSWSDSARAEEENASPPGVIPAAAAVEPDGPVPARSSSLLGKPVDPARLASGRGGTDVLNDMKLKGVVADNVASELTTGTNLISEGSFSGSSGMPMVIQNSGNNVLIQNATIVNVQVQ